MSDSPLARWIGHEIAINGIRWRVVQVDDPDPATARSTVRYERVYDKVRETPPILRDPEPIEKEPSDVPEL